MRVATLATTIVSLGLGLCPAATRGEAPASNIIERKPLLTASVQGGKRVARVEIKQIELRAHQPTSRHLHPCPVVGYIVSGDVTFQIAGQPPEHLHTGDAFYEPANTVIQRFDAGDKGATFIVNYLLGQDDAELIRML